ncbi:MAG: ATP-binding cassette domain-containing protein [Cytophagaceae bacterium]|jgi:ABC-type multidrug transport system ATPase subunit|nr:ATP-binding cassette domain-containing protein [Cytophagaceae bacterium]
MSEEILKSLAQLFAIITKQDTGVSESERNYVINSFKKRLNLTTAEQYIALYEEFLKDGENKEEGKKRLTSVKDSVRTLGICRKINKTLTHKQKIVVLVELLELLKTQGAASAQKEEIIDTVSTAFNIDKAEYAVLQTFVLKDDSELFETEEILSINRTSAEDFKGKSRHIMSENMHGNLFFIRVASADMMFLKYSGHDEINLNGLIIAPNTVVLFSQGSTARSLKGGVFYYSDILSQFISESAQIRLSFNVTNLEYRFPNLAIGLRDINISEGSGKLVGIMGASGAGKTTLLNVLAGLETPYKGEVLINGINLHKEKDKIRGIIGYIPQDDLLIEELTVFENLFYSAKLCFRDKSDAELTELVERVLADLGLSQIRNLQVGNPLNKTISGGQRKRVNIALELIREPSVLFVDEPTSGLSSRDSENVMDLLKELTLKGTLIFVVIHQPSSDIYKIFDRMFILDVGGFPIYYGNPVDAITYFKRISQQADSDKGQCQTCGNVNPEQIFNIIEEKVVDEYGNFTPNRKLTPKQWFDSFLSNFQIKKLEDIKDAKVQMLAKPGKFKQALIFATRDIKSKIYNRQYMIINMLEAPLLGFILAFILRYKNNTDHSAYLFRYNENIPAYILMSIVISIFIGLSISAEEIIKDRKILKRETFLNLSRNSYLISKVLILFAFSAIQSFLFVAVGNNILEIQGMFVTYWLMLFTVACFANVTGLIISSAFDTAITVYILVPLLLIPQMILSGAIFSFDKINDSIRSVDKVPVVADLMASRWAYEAIAVAQYRDNDYQQLKLENNKENLFQLEQKENITNYHIVYVLPEIRERIEYIKENFGSVEDSVVRKCETDLELVKYELQKLSFVTKFPDELKLLKYGSFTVFKGNDLLTHLAKLEMFFQKTFNETQKRKEDLLSKAEKAGQNLNKIKDNTFNESLSDLVRNATAKKRILNAGGYLAPKLDYVYFAPVKVEGKYDYRAHFFAPVKQFAGIYFNTYYFNVSVIWISTLLLYLVLYFDWLRKLLDFLGKLNFLKK